MSAAVATKLREAKARIERGWTRGDMALDTHGRSTPPKSPRACSWCAAGAVLAVAPNHSEYWELRCALVAANDFGCVTVWNDAPERTQAEVLAAFDRAIEIAERDQ